MREGYYSLKRRGGVRVSYFSLIVAKALCILILGCFLSGECEAQSVYTKDIASLKEELPKKHINLFFQLDHKSFDAELDNLVFRVGEMDLVDFAIALQQIVVKIGDSHTSVGYRQVLDNNKRLPIALYWFDDGLYVLQTVSEHERILGGRLEKIGIHPVAEVIDSLKTLIVQDNNALNKASIPELICHPQILSFFGFTNDLTSITLSFTNMNQEVVMEKFALGENRSNRVALQTKSTPLFWLNTNTIFWDYYDPNSEIYYVQYNACTGKEVAEHFGDTQMAAQLPSFNEFTQRIFATVREKPIKRFVFDMRFNGGGSSAQGTEFVSQLKEDDKLNKKGVLYVIIGRNTFSSAIINTLDFKNETHAVLVGEETSGMLNHYGEVRLFQMPESGLNIQYSTKFFRYSQEDIKTIKPDIEVTYNFEDYLNGVDPSMAAIIETSADIFVRVEAPRPTVTSIKEFENGDTNVDPSIKTITISFDRPLSGQGYSIFLGAKGQQAFPTISDIFYADDNKSIVMEVRLLPDKEYQFILTGKNFRTLEGIPLTDYEVYFKTAK